MGGDEGDDVPTASLSFFLILDLFDYVGRQGVGDWDGEIILRHFPAPFLHYEDAASPAESQACIYQLLIEPGSLPVACQVNVSAL